MCRGIEMQAYRMVTGTSSVIMTWKIAWKHFFKDQLLLFFFYSTLKIFLIRSQGATRGKVLRGFRPF